MNTKKTLRTCINCRRKMEKQQLVRVAKNKQGIISLDEKQKTDGRGLYFCKNEECFKAVIQKKLLNRGFKMQVAESEYEKIKNFEVE